MNHRTSVWGIVWRVLVLIGLMASIRLMVHAAEPVTVPPRVLSDWDVYTFGRPVFPAKLAWMRDAKYWLPPVDWIKEHGAAHKKYRPKYVVDAWDCDDFALQSVVLFSSDNLKLGRKCGVAFGIVQVQLLKPLLGIHPVDNDQHVLNLFLADDSQWYFYEPQNGKITAALPRIKDDTVRIVRVML